MLYPTFLYLNNIVVYKGWSFFDSFISSGEIVFNTGMTGYQEIITDPSYSGQIVNFSYPEIGNIGLNKIDSQSKKIHIKGLIAKNICLYPSNWRSHISLKDYIISKRIAHIFGIDTRALTKYLRSNGVMNGFIYSKSIKITDFYSPLHQSLDLVKRVTTSKAYNVHSNHLKSNFNVVLLDFGVKTSIINSIVIRHCNVIVVPANTSYDEIKLYNPDGILLSNGPGDPSVPIYAINTVQKLINFSNIPIFGICMGHQILSLAIGAKTFKLRFGHRALNHPIGISQYSEITSQNHGFATMFSSINLVISSYLKEISNFNLNDKTISGIFIKNKPIFSVQYHPEASPGPHDSDYLFDIFLHLIKLLKKV